MKESKLRNHRCLRPENARYLTKQGHSSWPTHHKGALMVPDVTAAGAGDPGSSVRPSGALSQQGDSAAGLIHRPCPHRLKGSSDHTVHGQPRLKLIPTFHRVRVECKLSLWPNLKLTQRPGKTVTLVPEFNQPPPLFLSV